MGASPKVKSRIEFKNIAYRGASGLTPENSLRACDLGVRHGASVVWVDVRVTRDGVPVLIQDDDTHRLTGSNGRVSAMTAKEVRRLRVRGGRGRRVFEEAIATLEEAILLLRDRCDFALDLVHDEDSEAPSLAPVFQLLSKYHLPPSTVLLSHSHALFQQMRAARPPYKVGRILGPRCSWQKFVEAVREQPHLLVLHRGVASPKAMRLCRTSGVRVWVYPIEHHKEFRRAVLLRPEGIVTPYPGRMRRYLERAEDDGV